MNSNESFRTTFDIKKCPRKITHNKSLMVFGSCFGEHIGNFLSKYHFKTCINPSGILYNPLSVSSAIKRIISGNIYTRSELFFYQELWRSLDHHTSFSDPDPDITIQSINSSFQRAVEAIRELDTLIITFGTAFAYYSKQDGRVAANCHKLPDDNFDRKLTPIKLIIDEYSELFKILYSIRPELQIVITVSPVRHLRDSARENQLSKSFLHSAIYELENMFPIYYFPAYEILMDDLRDYRFYDSDMVHPSQSAIEYILEKFKSACISEDSINFIKDFTDIINAMSHRLLRPDLESTHKFADTNYKKLLKISENHPETDLSAELDYFKKLL
jgi:hypothetical protein